MPRQSMRQRVLVTFLVALGVLGIVLAALVAYAVWARLHPTARSVAITGCTESRIQPFTSWPEHKWQYTLQCRLAGESPAMAPTCDEVVARFVSEHGALDGDVRVVVLRATTIECAKTYAGDGVPR